jgi:ATP-binding cassette subfamily F protein uup
MLLGEEPADSGSFDVGQTVRFGYYSQQGLEFNESDKVIDAARDIAEYVITDGNKIGVSQFLNLFLFPHNKQYDYISKLSGGEKRRLHLCTILMRNPNFLILDEPTNDLDIVTLTVLEEYLRTFNGCLIVVSHDRYFMDKVVDHLLVFKGNAEIQDFPGNYTQYRLWKEVKDAERNEQSRQISPLQQQLQRRQRPAEEKKKLSFKERREFDSLEEEIEALEKEKVTLEEELSSGTLSHEALLDKSARISGLIKEIDLKTERWIELSEYA